MAGPVVGAVIPLTAPRRLLIVDDDPGIQLLLAVFLKRRGFALLQARNGQDALAQMRAARPDLVLLDLMMPQVSGWDVLRERADDPELQRIPVIVMTATHVRGNDVRGQHVEAVLGKPFDLDLLLAIVNATLEPDPLQASA